MTPKPPALAMRATIIIPVYNVAPYLAQCLDSALGQDHDDIEVIAVDDGSTDNSLEVLKDFAARHRNVTVVSMENRGPSAARNAGLERATGDYVLFLDGDDYLEINTVSLCAKKMDDHGVDIVFFAARSFFDGVAAQSHRTVNYERSSELTDRPMSAEQFFVRAREIDNYLASACLYMYRRTCLGDIDFHPGILHEDNLFTTRLLLERRDTNVLCLPDQLFNRRLRPNSITTQKKQPRHIEGYLTVARELSRLEVARERSAAGRSLNQFIQSMIRSALANWWTAYPAFLPLAERKRLLALLGCVKPRYLQPRCVVSCLFPELLIVGHWARGKFNGTSG